MSRGSSGARFEHSYFEDAGSFVPCVIKSGDERVGEQGRWLLGRNTRALPEVYWTFDTSYVMEPLLEVHTDPYRVYELLRDYVWIDVDLDREPGRGVLFEPEALSRRLIGAISHVPHERRQAHGLNDLAAAAVEEISLDVLNQTCAESLSLRCTLIHGDPTLENVMLRTKSPESLVLIDPLPARPYAPDMREVDLGKILQSMAGFESDRYDELLVVDLARVSRWVEHVSRSENVTPKIVIWWGIVHLLRTFPYVSTAVRSRIIANSLQNLRTLLDWRNHARRL